RRHTRSKRDWSSDVCSSDLIERVFKDHPPDGGASSDLWQITLRDGTIVWNLHLVGLVRDTIVFQQDDKTVRYPLARVDEMRLVRSEERRVGKEGRARRAATE